MSVLCGVAAGCTHPAVWYLLHPHIFWFHFFTLNLFRHFPAIVWQIIIIRIVIFRLNLHTIPLCLIIDQINKGFFLNQTCKLLVFMLSVFLCFLLCRIIQWGSYYLWRYVCRMFQYWWRFKWCFVFSLVRYHLLLKSLSPGSNNRLHRNFLKQINIKKKQIECLL